MIQKVIRPPFLSLVGQSKAPDNDPGSSSGSGMFYDGPLKQESQTPREDSKSELKLVETIEKVHFPRSAAEIEQPGMTDVVLDLLEHRPEAAPADPGLTTTKYSNEASTAKGLLFNKKIE